MRLERDQRYGNIYNEAETDLRWVGDLGEKVFDSWARHLGHNGTLWLKDDAAGNADFLTPSGLRIGVKTVKRAGPPRPGYTAQITAQHAREPVDHFFFLSYENETKIMWLLGGIDQVTFLREARYYAAGEQVHANYVIRPDHEIFNIEIAKLICPEKWAHFF